ncbi:Hypothetical predicted protein [Mytilus galloprovincialis]|uniref:Uncharacterized protein n=1 Tax=Mytilus galloprovincialis TaxID=29158 RepID=A0A8B6BSL3_MYTGA|nr:Hypothetical predicted protein [Mytilus galloprovincialis]
MRKDIKQHIIRQCSSCCKLRKAINKNQAAMQNYQDGYPMDIVALYVMGPFPKSKTGNRFILLVIGDHFNRWMEAYQLPNQYCHNVAEKLVISSFLDSEFRWKSILIKGLIFKAIYSNNCNAQKSANEYVDDLRVHMEEIYHVARENLKQRSCHQLSLGIFIDVQEEVVEIITDTETSIQTKDADTQTDQIEDFEKQLKDQRKKGIKTKRGGKLLEVKGPCHEETARRGNNSTIATEEEKTGKKNRKIKIVVF